MGHTLEQLQGLIQTHQTKAQAERDELDKYGRWYNSEFYSATHDLPTGIVAFDEDRIEDGGRSEVTMETNYPYAFVDTMVANVCPSNPAVTVNARRGALREAARYREALINDILRRNVAHELLWVGASKASVFGRCFFKVVWNPRRQMPVFRTVDPRNFWYDQSIEHWDDLRYAIEVTVLTRADFEKRVRRQGKKGFYDTEVAEKASFASYPAWLRDATQSKAMYNEAALDVFEWCVIYEVYDFSDDEGRFYHFIDGVTEPLMAAELPFKFIRNPYRMLIFNENLRDSGGLSDVKLIAGALERLNELDTLELWYAQTSIPTTILNSGLVDDPDSFKTQLKNVSGPGEMVDVKGKSRAPLKDIIGSTPTPSLSMSFREMRDRIIGTIEFTLGIPQYSRGQVGVTDVATEVALADAATRTRNGRRQKRINDIIAWMAEAIIALFEEYMADDEILPVRLTGKRFTLDASRITMALRDLKAELGEEQLVYDYEALPHSTIENSRLVQLKNLRDNWDVLSQAATSGIYDAAKLYQHFAEMLNMPDIVTDKPPPQAGQPAVPPGAPPPDDGGAMPVPGTETISAPGMPAGIEQPLPIELLDGAGTNEMIGAAAKTAKSIQGVQPGPFKLG